jgi:hypothetical protein
MCNIKIITSCFYSCIAHSQEIIPNTKKHKTYIIKETCTDNKCRWFKTANEMTEHVRGEKRSLLSCDAVQCSVMDGDSKVLL